MDQFIKEMKAYRVGDEIFKTEEEAEEYLNDLDCVLSFEGMGDWDIFDKYYDGYFEEDDEDADLTWTDFYSDKEECEKQMQAMEEALKDVSVDITIKQGTAYVELSGKYGDVTKALSDIPGINYEEDTLEYDFPYDRDVKRVLESLNEDLSKDEEAEIKDLLNQFKTIYTKLYDLLLKLPQEESNEIQSILANINLSNATVNSDLTQIDNAIKDIEKRLNKKPMRFGKDSEVYDVIYDIVTDIDTQATEASSFIASGYKNHEADMIEGLERALGIEEEGYEFLTDFYNYDGDEFENYFGKMSEWDPYYYVLNEEELDESELTKENYKELVDMAFKNLYDYYSDKSFLNDAYPEEDDQKIFKETFLDGWKENLPH